MKFKTVFFIIFLFLLISCTPDAPAYTETPKIISTFVVTQTATQTPSPTATLPLEQQITAMVNKSKETGIFPSGLTEEQERAWFEELNRQSGHAFIFDMPGDASSVLVNVPPDLYPNFGDTVKTAKRWEEPKKPQAQETYGDYSNTWIVPRNFFETKEGKEIAEQLKRNTWTQIIYLKDEFGKPTNQLAFFDQVTNQYIPIIDSEKVDSEFWQAKITKENVDDYFQPDEKAYRIIMQGENVAIPVVLAQIPQAGLDKFLLPMTQGSVSVGAETVDTIAILQFKNERGETVLVGKLTKFIITAKALYATFLEQGNQELIYEARNSSAFRNERYLSLKGQPIMPAGIYYALVSTDLKKTDSGVSGLGASWLAEGTYCQSILGTDTLKSTEYSCGVTDLAPGPVLVKKTE